MSSLASHPTIRRSTSVLRAVVVDLENALAALGEFPIRRAALQEIYDSIVAELRALERIR